MSVCRGLSASCTSLTPPSLTQAPLAQVILGLSPNTLSSAFWSNLTFGSLQTLPQGAQSQGRSGPPSQCLRPSVSSSIVLCRSSKELESPVLHQQSIKAQLFSMLTGTFLFQAQVPQPFRKQRQPQARQPSLLPVAGTQRKGAIPQGICPGAQQGLSRKARAKASHNHRIQ